MATTATLEEIETATAHLLETVEGFSDSDVHAPSLLPGWTRGHVLTHLARSADGLRNLLIWARTGVETPMYTSRRDRDADIEAGAGRSAAELLADVRDSAKRFADDVRTMPQQAWSVPVRGLTGPEFPASDMLWRRLQEVEVHHVDLAARYTPAHWPADFTSRALGRCLEYFSQKPDCPAFHLYADDTGRRFTLGDPQATAGACTVSGPERALLAWLIGRSTGDGLGIEPQGPLLQLPAWI